MTNLDKLFPVDPEITDEDVDRELNRSHKVARIIAGGALATATAYVVHEAWHRFHPFSGIDQEQ